MNILCNIFPVSSSDDSIARTGVHRVVERLTDEWIESRQCQVCFHAIRDIWRAYEYYQSHLRSPVTSWAAPAWQINFSKYLSKLEDRLYATLHDRRLHLRLARRVILSLTTLCTRWLSHVSDRILAKTDIYHSPFLPVPEWVKRHSHLRRFTTVYDLIPLTNPEFFAADGNIPALLRRLVEGLGPEDWVLCISSATRTALLKYNPRLVPDKVSVTHLAAAACFHPERDEGRLAKVRVRYGLPTDGEYFLSVCTLEPRKNLDGVIRAFARLRREGALPGETRLVLVGNIGWRTEGIFRALEEAANCREAIVLTGYVPDEDLAALYSGALGFVYPSRAEGFGLPPLEAMQCGTPVITSNVSSLPEVVGDAGLLVAPDDIDGLCAAMRTLHDDRDLRARLAECGSVRARTFSWKRFIDETISAYRRALATRGGEHD